MANWIISKTFVQGIATVGEETITVNTLGGVKGEKGDVGIQGIQGDQGEKGDTGIQGIQGDTGLQGIQGIQGIQGEKGDQGDITGTMTVTNFVDRSDGNSFLPSVGVAGTSYKVSNDLTDPTKNGYWHYSGGWVKDANLANGLVASGNVDAVSGGVVYNENNHQNQITTSIVNVDENLETTLSNGYLNKSDGTFISQSGYRLTDFISVNKNTYIKRKGTELQDFSTASPFYFYDKNKNYLGWETIAQVKEEEEILVGDYFPTAEFVKVCSTTAVEIEVYLTNKLVKRVEKVETRQQYTINPNYDHATSVINGFLTNTGDVTTTANWRVTKEFVNVVEGDILLYKGYTTSTVKAVIGYDSDKLNPVVLLGAIDSLTDYTDVIIPSGVEYVKSSARMIDGDVFEFIGSKRIGDVYLPDYWIPETLYSKQGDDFRINPFGIIAKHPEQRDTDILFSSQLSNELSYRLTPSTELDNNVTLFARDTSGELRNLGLINILNTKSTNIINPAIPQNFICLGDSLTEGIGSSINGCYSNELSRRLTGVGTAALSGGESPTALSLSNVYFRGTRGDQPIKHEGRGGWKAISYLTYASLSGVTNEFWNPTTEEFDLDYYITNNGFDIATGGIDATGSNLTMIILLGWNNAYTDLQQGIEDLKTLISKMKADRSGVKVKVLGLTTPPKLIYKTFTDDRNVSFESIMRDVIIPFNKGYQDLANDDLYKDYVEFVPISPIFIPDDSYATTNMPISLRNSNTYEVSTDYVHPKERGYAQIADALFYNILYNYCKI